MRKVERIDDLVPVRTAIVSVSDKRFLEELVPGLVEVNPEVRVLSTGGTATKLREIMGADCRNIEDVSAYTGMPETEGGLVKTLHHKLFLGYLTETHCTAHQNDLAREGATPIDLVAFNLYPFQDAVDPVKRAEKGLGPADVEDARMNIDVGGPSALRAATKNWHRIATVVDPEDYQRVLEELNMKNGHMTIATRFDLQKKVWEHLAQYNRAIADHFAGKSVEEALAPYEVLNQGE